MERQHTWGTGRSPRRLFLGLLGLFVLAECGVWQLLRPARGWPWALIRNIDVQNRHAIAIVLLGVTFITALVVLVQCIARPLRQLADHVAEVSERSLADAPQIPCERRSDIEGIRASIDRLVATLEQHHEDLLQQTLNDPLTGLGNRRLLEQRLETLLPLGHRLHASISAMMIDVDHFKAYNDYYGHPAGDACLIEIANVLRDTFRRDTDVIIRFGGEEFLVVLVNVSGEDAVGLAEAMRSMLQLVGLPHEKSETAATVTVSIGVATAASGLVMGLDTLIACADECLYHCKAEGRNRSMHRFVDDARAMGDSIDLVRGRTEKLFRVSA